MAEILLVRHGQANSSAKTEAEYDKLSDLGHQQARWLGERLAKTNGHFERIVTGTLRRHRETADGIIEGIGNSAPRHEDARWNELEYYTMAEAYEAQHGVPFPQNQSDYVAHAPQMMQVWHDDGLTDIPERFSEFDARITAALADAAQGGGRILVVTSGGVIAGLTRRFLDLGIPSMVKVLLHTANSSLHRVEMLQGTPYLNGYNDLSHLDAPDRAHARTYI